MKYFPVVLARILWGCILQGPRYTEGDTVWFTFTEVAFTTDHIDFIKMNITKRTCENAHLATGATVTVNLYRPGLLVSDNRGCWTNLQAPGFIAVHTGLGKADFDIIMVFDTDVRVFAIEIA